MSNSLLLEPYRDLPVIDSIVSLKRTKSYTTSLSLISYNLLTEERKWKTGPNPLSISKMLRDFRLLNLIGIRNDLFGLWREELLAFAKVKGLQRQLLRCSNRSQYLEEKRLKKEKCLLNLSNQKIKVRRRLMRLMRIINKKSVLLLNKPTLKTTIMKTLLTA